MKNFTRKEPLVSLCGLNCALCSMHLGGYCPGCGGGEGNQSCAIARCSLQHDGIQFCWECPEYPCPRYEGFDAYDSFVPHRNRQQDAALAREMGLEACMAQLHERMAILSHHGGTGCTAGAGEGVGEGTGPCRRRIAAGGSGPAGRQIEAEQETEEGVSVCRLPG